MAESEFVYLTFIRTTPEKLWRALKEPEFTRQFWMNTTQECEWKPGASRGGLKPDGSVADSGEAVEIEPHKRLVLKWQNHMLPEMTAEGFSRLTYELDEKGDSVKLTVTHVMDKKNSKLIGAVSNGGPIILSSLKSLLETGESLGGVRDEAEIRGHRRTYIGALPGRLVRALRDAGTMNPVILLDEVDKVGADWRGDPSSALLEVLDPAQNHSFRDHYLDVELDLSQVLFIATANQADTVPGPLLDRMEVISFDGYSGEEKLAIAQGYLWPRQRDRNGLVDGEVSISDELIRTVIAEYTREAGVRNLERELGKLLRKTATRIVSGKAEAPIAIDIDAVRDALGRQRFFQESAARTAVPGVATGLAVTGAGGDVLFVEATTMKTHGSSAGLVLTGQLGDVMKESAKIALSYVRGHAGELGIADDAFDEHEFHIHVPAGAIPKDGPSAGVTMVTALASLLSGRPVRHTVGMTGEVTLQGRVLPIGGLKQKALAAHAAGLTDVVIPERNRGDLDEIPIEVRDTVRFHPVMTVGEVLELALEPAAHDVALS